MSQALVEANSTTDIVVSPNLPLTKTPKEILQDAHLAAKELQAVISKKKKPVTFNGELYLEFEDWQTLGKFYGLTVKIVSTKFVEFGEVKGFEAIASVINVNSGIEVSSAEALCLNDERNWSNKPLFQLKSMAQTRAGSKAFRNVLAWVVVMAGYKPTPAEEIQETRGHIISPSVPSVSVVKQTKHEKVVEQAKEILGAKEVSPEEASLLATEPNVKLFDATDPINLEIDQPKIEFGDKKIKNKDPYYEIMNENLVVFNSYTIKDKLKRNGFHWNVGEQTWRKTYSTFDEEALKQMIKGDK